MSHRTDTAYWKANFNKTWEKKLYTLEPSSVFTLINHAFLRDENFSFDTQGGAHCIATGMNWKPNDENMAKLQNNITMEEIKDKAEEILKQLQDRKSKWKEECEEEGESFLNFHKYNVYY